MSNFLFFTIQPDDYHGAPMIGQVFPSKEGVSTFPKIPTHEEVFDLWMEAGYNSFYMNGEEDSEKWYFDNYGNHDLFYHIYFIAVEPDEDPYEIVNSVIEEISYINVSEPERKFDEDDFIELLQKEIDDRGYCLVLM